VSPIWNRRACAAAAGLIAVVVVPTAAAHRAAGPVNTVKPSVARPLQMPGPPQVGERLVVNTGTWSGGVTSYGFRWERCAGGSTSACSPIAGETGRAYTVRTGDVGATLRAVVTAQNSGGSSAATSDPTEAVVAAQSGTTTTTATTTVATVNRAPTISLLSAKIVSGRVYVRVRLCDDARSGLTLVARDVKGGLASTHRFSTASCGIYQRSWRPAPRYRSGRFTVTLQATDTSAKSSRIVRHTFS
jgi:hypothetical protein